MLNLTLGTAGHIDHGKTALVKLLTGCETDRLKEEKERGMSIDLGYAPCRIADLEVGIVDVPGHENFVKTMVAGASGMDGVILVVAADDGVMPQTREHLHILTLLGVKHGLVALTKIDRVDLERRRAAEAELAGFLRGTFLDGAAILPLSNVSGEGFEPFLEALHDLVRAMRPKSIDGVFRLPVDRAFSVRGLGTVAAGIPIAGSAAVGDELVLLPQAVACRVKRIEVYGQESGKMMAGQCAAVNLTHRDAGEIVRGNVLALPGYFQPQEFFICRMRLLPEERSTLKNAAEVRFHTGTSEVNAVVYLLEAGEISGEGEHLIQIRARRPIIAGPRDPFILRSLSPVRTIGGGAVVEAVPRRLKRNRPEIRADVQRRAEAVADDARFVEFAVRSAPQAAVGKRELAQRTKLLDSQLDAVLSELVGEKKVLALEGGLYLHAAAADEAGQRIVDLLAEHHRRAAASPGMTPDQLREACPWQKPARDAIVKLLLEGGRIVEREGRYALPEHRPSFSAEDAARLEAIEDQFRRRLFNPPSATELAETTGLQPAVVERLLKVLCDNARLASAEGTLFHRQAVEEARRRLIEHIRREGCLESVRFKYLLDTTRKYALPLLDHFDRIGLLRRVGNTRYLRTPRQSNES